MAGYRKDKDTNGMVDVEVRTPFHTGIDTCVYYNQGDIVRVDKDTARRWISNGLANPKTQKNNKKQQ